MTVGATEAESVTISNPGSGSRAISSVSASGPFTERNGCGSTLAAGASCTVTVTFAPTAGVPATGTLTIANSSPTPSLTVSLSGLGVSSTTNLALGATMSASGYTPTYTPSNANDGNTSTYWESLDNSGYPQTLTVDLGSPTSIGSVVLELPPSSAWASRTESLSILGSTDGSAFAQLVASTGCTFDPSTGNTTTITLPSGTSTRYLRLSFTGNTGWPAAQVAEFEIFAP